MLKRVINTCGLLSRTVGLKARHLALFLFILINSRLAKGLSNKTRQVSEDPVFVIGHLRSSTTFIHRLLGKADSLYGTKLDTMIFGAGSYHSVVDKLLGSKLKRVSLDKMYDPKIHKTGFDLLESDDIAFYFQDFGGLLYWIYFQAWESFANPKAIKKSIKKAIRSKRFLHDQRKHLARICPPGKRLLSKSFFGIYHVDSIQSLYPSAKFLLLIRDPKEVIPSTLSLELSIQESLNNFSQQPAELQRRYISNLYEEVKIYYEQLDNVLSNSRADLAILHYEEVKEKFEISMGEITAFLGLENDQGWHEAIREQLAKQTEYKSKHKYSLDTYGISEDQIEEDFTRYYLRFKDGSVS